VKDFKAKGISRNFSSKYTTTMKKAGVDIVRDDMLMNYTHPDDMAMKSIVRGSRKRPQTLLDSSSSNKHQRRFDFGLYYIY